MTDTLLTEAETWRVGHKVPLNVYEGDRPVCQCHNTEDAARIALAMNEIRRLRADLGQAAKDIGWLWNIPDWLKRVRERKGKNG